jgi:hypothetical protein
MICKTVDLNLSSNVYTIRASCLHFSITLPRSRVIKISKRLFLHMPRLLKLLTTVMILPILGLDWQDIERLPQLF